MPRSTLVATDHSLLLTLILWKWMLQGSRVLPVLVQWVSLAFDRCGTCKLHHQLGSYSAVVRAACNVHLGPNSFPWLSCWGFAVPTSAVCYSDSSMTAICLCLLPTTFIQKTLLLTKNIVKSFQLQRHIMWPTSMSVSAIPILFILSRITRSKYLLVELLNVVIRSL